MWVITGLSILDILARVVTRTIITSFGSNDEKSRRKRSGYGCPWLLWRWDVVWDQVHHGHKPQKRSGDIPYPPHSIPSKPRHFPLHRTAPFRVTSFDRPMASRIPHVGSLYFLDIQLNGMLCT
jgi:hypothetical protein